MPRLTDLRTGASSLEHTVTEISNPNINSDHKPARRFPVSFFRLFATGTSVLLSLLLLALVAYRPILNNTLIGDDYNLAQSAGEIPLTNIWRLFSVLSPEFMRPLPLFSWWLEYRLFGFSGLPGHLFNVFLHAGSACVLYFFLGKMGAARVTALLAAVLFLLNPVGPEAVTWVSGRFDVMSLLLLLLALVLYVAALRSKSTAAYVGAMVCSAAALLSKESAMVLVVVLPALELIKTCYLDADGRTPPGILFRGSRMAQASLRLAVFFLIFIVYILLRFAVMGRLGGYAGAPRAGVPTFSSIMNTVGTLLAPFNSFQFPAATIYAVEIYTAGLLLLSVFLVAWRWRRVSGQVRRLWLFLALFFVISIGPVFPYVFLANNGISRDMNCSRFLYVTALGLTSLMVVGLLEFGWRQRIWRFLALGSILMLVPVYLWGLNHNNRPWEQSAVTSYSIPRETHELLADPPQDANLYFQGIPTWSSGAYVFVNGLERAMHGEYGRQDIRVFQLAAGQDPPEGEDGFLFSYDESLRRMTLIRGPR